MTRRYGAAMAVAFMFIAGTNAAAWHVSGKVYCAGTGLPLEGVIVNVTQLDGTFTGFGISDPSGFYSLSLPDVAGSFSANLDLSAVGGGNIVTPNPVPVLFLTTDADVAETINWVVDSPRCSTLACWLTGGGAKFSTITGTTLAERGPQQNFGGNVYPGCSPDAGQGGQWNHVDHTAKLHFQGRAIIVDQCGNVDGIPPGSESPVTPFNFIEFHGTGTLKGIKGNKVDFGEVCFVGRAEDRNEPGSSGQRDGAKKDRYFIRVTDCSSGATLLQLEDVLLPGDSDPVTITDGNLQIHVSSCDTP
jgi:hypothetical protein